jgi:tyrosine-protein kinase Etk/Wzc
MENQDNLLGVISTVLRYRKMMFRLAISAGILTAGISFLLPTYYASTASFYAASPQLANPEIMFGFTAQVAEYYGGEHDLDRLLSIAESNELTDFMVKKFDLYAHYDIDSTKMKAPHSVRTQFRELYKIEKTKADAIEITIEDTDRNYAMQMSNAAMGKINDLASRMTRESQGQVIQAFDINMAKKRILLQLYGDSLTLLRKQSGIIDPGTQGQLLAEMVGKAETQVTKNSIRLAELEGNPAIPRDTIAYIKADLKAYQKEYFDLTNPNSNKSMNVDRFNDGLSKITELQDLHYQARKQLSYDLERYNQIQAAYRTNFPSIHIVQAGELPVIKSRPTRSLIVIGAMIAALIFGLLAAIFSEYYKDVRWSELGKD